MGMNVSDFVWHRLHEWGISRVYGYPATAWAGST
jgi:thiamine pyrophosphate-dependent acetolactate synthase large subunit-like protein